MATKLVRVWAELIKNYSSFEKYVKKVPPGFFFNM
jgi:hypothetical protein